MKDHSVPLVLVNGFAISIVVDPQNRDKSQANENPRADKEVDIDSKHDRNYLDLSFSLFMLLPRAQSMTFVTCFNAVSSSETSKIG